MTAIRNGSRRNLHWEERRREIRLRRSNLIDKQDGISITYKIAQDTLELETAFELVWDAYVKVGLQADDGAKIRFTKYHLLPTTKVLVAIHHPELEKENPDYSQLKKPGAVVGTLTLVFDSPLGLPMEEICCEEINELRRSDHQLVEVIGLSVNPEFRKHNIMMYLYKLMFQYVNFKGATDVACSVTKRHINFYRTMLLFEPLGELKQYTAANQMETQCHILNIQQAEQHAQEIFQSRHFDADLYTFFFTSNLTAEQPCNEGSPWTPEQITYFISQRTKFVNTLDEKTRRILKQEYRKAASEFHF